MTCCSQVRCPQHGEKLCSKCCQKHPTSNDTRLQTNYQHSFVTHNLCIYDLRLNRGHVGMESTGGTTWIPINQTCRRTFTDPQHHFGQNVFFFKTLQCTSHCGFSALIFIATLPQETLDSTNCTVVPSWKTSDRSTTFSLGVEAWILLQVHGLGAVDWGRYESRRLGSTL